MTYLDYLNTNYPIRKTKEEKENFRSYVRGEAANLNYSYNEETLEKKHTNIILGDIKNAKVILTAHYDTPATSIFPNIMMPRNLVLFYIYQFAIVFIYLGVAYAFANLLKLLFEIDYFIYMFIFLITYYLLFILGMLTFKNKKNYNDNTSGVATLLSIAKTLDETLKEKVAFVFFDNEEKGLKGSKALRKKYPNIFENKLLINFDCVGNGENILIIVTEKAENLKEFQPLKNSFTYNSKFTPFFFPKKGSVCNSDHKHFPCGVGVVACKKAKIVGFYAGRIHTPRDIVSNNENIEYITSSMNSYINVL